MLGSTPTRPLQSAFRRAVTERLDALPSGRPEDAQDRLRDATRVDMVGVARRWDYRPHAGNAAAVAACHVLRWTTPTPATPAYPHAVAEGYS